MSSPNSKRVFYCSIIDGIKSIFGEFGLLYMLLVFVLLLCDFDSLEFLIFSRLIFFCMLKISKNQHCSYFLKLNMYIILKPFTWICQLVIYYTSTLIFHCLCILHNGFSNFIISFF